MEPGVVWGQGGVVHGGRETAEEQRGHCSSFSVPEQPLAWSTTAGINDNTSHIDPYSSFSNFNCLLSSKEEDKNL